MTNQQKETECCPKFDPKPWDEKMLEWKEKKFIKGSVWCFCHIPLNFGQVISGLMKKVETAGARAEDWMCLSDHTSKWKMNIYVAVDKEVEGAENVELSGQFLTKAYEGDFKDTGKWCADFEEFAKTKKVKIEKFYMWYTTCPKCAKKWGKNYVVVVGLVHGL